jgi:hypothetical protein
MATPTRWSWLDALLRGLVQDIQAGRLLSQQPHNVDMCTCCEGDPRLRRCDDLLRTTAPRH